MSSHQPIQGPQGHSGAMLRVLTLISMLSGFAVVLIYQFTQPMIAENQRQAIERAIFDVIPAASSWQVWQLNESGLVRAGSANAEGVTLYAGYDAHGQLQGIAAEAAAQGYADTIRLLFGYDPRCQCITGIKILKSAETPGLGDKIFKDRAFIANFDALQASLNAAADGLENAIVTVKHGTKREPWQIDSISGATVSSKAVGKALNDGARFLLPRLVPHLSVIETVQPTQEAH